MRFLLFELRRRRSVGAVQAEQRQRPVAQSAARGVIRSEQAQRLLCAEAGRAAHAEPAARFRAYQSHGSFVADGLGRRIVTERCRIVRVECEREDVAYQRCARRTLRLLLVAAPPLDERRAQAARRVGEAGDPAASAGVVEADVPGVACGGQDDLRDASGRLADGGAGKESLHDLVVEAVGESQRMGVEHFAARHENGPLAVFHQVGVVPHADFVAGEIGGVHRQHQVAAVGQHGERLAVPRADQVGRQSQVHERNPVVGEAAAAVLVVVVGGDFVAVREPHDALEKAVESVEPFGEGGVADPGGHADALGDRLAEEGGFGLFELRARQVVHVYVRTVGDQLVDEREVIRRGVAHFGLYALQPDGFLELFGGCAARPARGVVFLQDVPLPFPQLHGGRHRHVVEDADAELLGRGAGEHRAEENGLEVFAPVGLGVFDGVHGCF